MMMMMLRGCLLLFWGCGASAFLSEPSVSPRIPTLDHKTAFSISNQPWRRRDNLNDDIRFSNQKCHVPTALAMSVSTPIIAVDENANREIGSFEEWAVACGVQVADGFQLMVTSQDPSLDVGVYTSMDLPKDTPVLFVPNEVTLSANRAKEEFGTITDAEDLFVQLNAYDQVQRFYLFLKILKEYELGDQSPWYPWLNSLPRYFSTGASMTHYCCTECLPPLVGSLALKEKTRFKQFFKALDFCYFLSPETRGNKEIAKWAYNVCLTRSFQDGHGDYKVAPMADMFNHDSTYEIQGRYDDDGNFYATTLYDVPAGTPLRMSYTAGDNSNPSFLFARYGFLDHSSPATFCKILVPNPSPQLIEMGYNPSRMLFYKETGDVSQEVWDVLLYQILEASNNVQQLQALYQAHVSGDEQTKQAIHDEHYGETLTALRNHVDGFLMQLDELSAKAQGRDLNVHPRLPLILQHNQFVRETFLRVQANLNQ
ncbi:unnamed protein product [Cylindrotheca closterium]|uniref:SET domain-containing protein n=1 Tax=Cylindrotheca closterium TaxID=2856 RepID=A0AAD2JMI8_9STRA|nr:unnamed protein product [Cylindrotheca closterium]